MQPTEQDIAIIREKAGSKELHEIVIEHDGEEFTLIITAPSRVEWMKFLGDLTSTEDIAFKNQAHENLVLVSAQYPARDIIREFIGRKFGALTEVTEHIGKLVGAGAKVRTKKL